MYRPFSWSIMTLVLAERYAVIRKWSPWFYGFVRHFISFASCCSKKNFYQFVKLQNGRSILTFLKKKIRFMYIENKLVNPDFNIWLSYDLNRLLIRVSVFRFSVTWAWATWDVVLGSVEAGRCWFKPTYSGVRLISPLWNTCKSQLWGWGGTGGGL